MRPSAVLAGLAVLLGTAAVAPASGGELAQAHVSPAMPWTPTACVRPVSPLGHGFDAATLNAVVGRFNAYADAAQAYVDCVSRESLADRRAVQQAIEAAERRVNADMLAEVEGARARLTSGGASPR